MPLTPMREVPRGIVRPASGRMPFRVTRWHPPKDLAPFLVQVWRVQWDVPEGQEHVQHTLPDPCVHVVFEGGEGNVQGLLSTRFERRLVGSGEVMGLRFRPAAYRALHPEPLWALRGVRHPWDGPLPEDPADPESVCRWLRARVPRALPEPLAALADLAERMAEDRSLRRVSQVAERVGVSARTLQRRFKDAVGWTPLEVLRRRRVHDLLEALDAGERDLAGLAYQVGYADQAHMGRDFKGLVGCAPGAYLRRADR